MRKALKIFFVILAIAIIGVGAYFVFFDIDRNLTVYNDTNNAMLYKYNLGLDGDLLALDEYGYNKNTITFGDNKYPEIDAIRQKMLSHDKLQGGVAESGYLNYYGYTEYEAVLTEGIKYYSSYASLANNASKRSANVMSSVIGYYKSSIASLYEQAVSVKNLQFNLEVVDSGVTAESMLQAYETLRLTYRDYLKNSATLLLDLRDYIIEESFNNNYNFETIAVLYDSVAETISVAMSSKIEQEINYLHDASIYVDKYNEYVNNGTIDYGIVEEINYLLAYKKLYFESRIDYDRLFKLTHFQKYDLVHGNNNISSTITVGYVDYATIVVDLLEL